MPIPPEKNVQFVERQNKKPTEEHQPNGRQHKNRTPAFLLTRYDGHFSADRDIRMYLVGGLKKTRDKKIDGKI